VAGRRHGYWRLIPEEAPGEIRRIERPGGDQRDVDLLIAQVDVETAFRRAARQVGLDGEDRGDDLLPPDHPGPFDKHWIGAGDEVGLNAPRCVVPADDIPCATTWLRPDRPSGPRVSGSPATRGASPVRPGPFGENVCRGANYDEAVSPAQPSGVAVPSVLPAERLDGLVQALRRLGFAVHAPVMSNGALMIRPIQSSSELPRGVVDEQSPGTHRLRTEGDGFFDYTVPADSWKRLFFPPRLQLWQAAAQGARFVVSEPAETDAPAALLGVRGCDLEAILVQDRVFMEGAHPDPHYRARREKAFIVAVNCARATSTCFCTSMGSGPRVRRAYDIGLTELRDGGHRFLVEAASERGREVLALLGAAAAGAADRNEADTVVAKTAASIKRTMPGGIADTLRGAQASSRWQSIADRCLSCGNCTMVCPTCFCSAVEHTTDLDGTAHHERRWDSCFNSGHSYIHGGSVRGSTAPRYRQWLTHKLSTWHEQFDTSGCTGCGRCIVWCPVAIDITEEAHAFTKDAAAQNLTGART